MFWKAVFLLHCTFQWKLKLKFQCFTTHFTAIGFSARVPSLCWGYYKKNPVWYTPSHQQWWTDRSVLAATWKKEYSRIFGVIIFQGFLMGLRRRSDKVSSLPVTSVFLPVFLQWQERHSHCSACQVQHHLSCYTCQSLRSFALRVVPGTVSVYLILSANVDNLLKRMQLCVFDWLICR